ncbi:MAG: TlpA family protein disulfide reductase [Fibrobacterales bacterium]
MKWLLTFMTTITLALPLAAKEYTLPSFSLSDIEGITHSVDEYKGKVVVLDFWATWCVTCRYVFPKLNEIYKSSASDKVAILGINTDKKFKKKKLKKYIKKNRIEYPVLFDQKSTLAPKLGVTAVPSLMVFDTTGKLIAHMNGYDVEEEEKIIAQIKALIK